MITENDIISLAEKLQKEFHSKIDEMIKVNPTLTHQDCFNSVLLLEIAQLYVKIVIVQNQTK